MDALALLREVFRVAVDAADPRALTPYLPPLPDGRVMVVGAGKAAAAMAQGVEAHYPLERLAGLVVTRYGHALPTKRIEVVEASHPLPSEAGVEATERILQLVQALGEDEMLLCLISGGGSALLCAPDGVTLEEKIGVTQALLRSGASIQEMNCVRKHLSRVKGGRLAAACKAQVVSLILSDVVGDDLASIASGPTVADPSTYREALEVLARYRIDAPAAKRALEAGARGERAETPKPGDPRLEKVENILVASNQQSLEEVAAFLCEQGLAAHILSSEISGEAREVAKVHAAIARQVKARGQPFAPPCALLSGGETTVTVRGKGKGGRNSEFLLALALELRGREGFYALAADTDGIDGSEDNAGALYYPRIFEAVPEHEARALLDKNDSYTFFARAGALLKSGPTRTNVNDLRVILIL
jgi:hydroxypyruvate reductase